MDSSSTFVLHLEMTLQSQMGLNLKSFRDFSLSSANRLLCAHIFDKMNSFAHTSYLHFLWNSSSQPRMEKGLENAD